MRAHARTARQLLFRAAAHSSGAFMIMRNVSRVCATWALALLPLSSHAQSEREQQGVIYGSVDAPATGADAAPRHADPVDRGDGGAHRVFGHEDLPGPDRTIREAKDVLAKMRQDPDMATALPRARGIFLVPGYATAALVIGGAGGSGVMLEHQNGSWSAPVFFNIGSASLGLQAGVAVGPMALLLMNEDAVLPFHDVSNFSLDAEAGLTVLNWSAVTEATAGRGDVVVWSDMTGLVGDLSVAVTNINFDEDRTSRYYRQRVVSPTDVLTGAVEDPHDETLQTEFAEFTRRP
jgi:SH3 domain-containing YSC84-like protein 1